MHKFYLPFYFAETYPVIKEWLKDCCQKDYDYVFPEPFSYDSFNTMFFGWIEFEDNSDAMLFKLRWL